MNKKEIIKEQIIENSRFLIVGFILVVFSSYAMFISFNANKSLIKQSQANISAPVVVFEEEEEDDEVLFLEEENPFVDIPMNFKYINSILSLYYLGIVDGYPDNTFKPEKKVTRAEFIKILMESFFVNNGEYEVEDDLKNCFFDVKDEWFSEFICIAFEMGIVKGFEGDMFYPDRNITKAEALKLIFELYDFDIPLNEEIEVSYFSDVKLNDWFLGVSVLATENDLADKRFLFNPFKQLNRGEVADIVFKVMN